MASNDTLTDSLSFSIKTPPSMSMVESLVPANTPPSEAAMLPSNKFPSPCTDNEANVPRFATAPLSADAVLFLKVEFHRKTTP